MGKPLLERNRCLDVLRQQEEGAGLLLAKLCLVKDPGARVAVVRSSQGSLTVPTLGFHCATAGCRHFRDKKPYFTLLRCF